VRAAVIVLVLAGIAAVVVGLVGVHQPLVPRRVAPVGLAGRKPADPMAIANFAGAGQQIAPLDDFGPAAAVLTPEEISVFKGSGLVHVQMDEGHFDDGVADVLVAQLGSPAQARSAQRQLVALQLGFGFSRGPQPGVGSTVLGAVPGKPDILPGGRAHYTHGDLLIRVEFRGPGVAAAQASYARVLALQLEALPADG
jgi:hypothetical protein